MQPAAAKPKPAASKSLFGSDSDDDSALFGPEPTKAAAPLPAATAGVWYSGVHLVLSIWLNASAIPSYMQCQNNQVTVTETQITDTATGPKPL